MTPVLEAVDQDLQGTFQPVGYLILIRIPNLPAQMKNWGNLYRPDENRALEEIAQLVGQVVAMGPDAYADRTKFPSGPWCKVGDCVMLRAYTGTRFARVMDDGTRLHYALINDDTVQAVVSDEMVANIERPS